jgi:BASS family bile acid:Na+ symporter
MAFVASIGLPALVILMMLVVGLELVLADLTRVLRVPWLASAVLVSQALLLPLLAGLLITALHLDAALAGGLILVAASPIAAISNYYALLARGDVALAVALTACSSVLALFTVPLVAGAGFRLLMEQDIGVAFPYAKVVLQILIGLVLPVIFGMIIRRFAPRWAERNRGRLTRLTLTGLALLVGYVLFDQAPALLRGAVDLMLAAVAFTAAAFATGYGLSALLRRNQGERTAVAIGFGIRNLGAAIMVGATVLGRLDFVAFSALFFLTQLLLTIPFILRSKRATPPQP